MALTNINGGSLSIENNNYMKLDLNYELIQIIHGGRKRSSFGLSYLGVLNTATNPISQLISSKQPYKTTISYKKLADTLIKPVSDGLVGVMTTNTRVNGVTITLTSVAVDTTGFPPGVFKLTPAPEKQETKTSIIQSGAKPGNYLENGKLYIKFIIVDPIKGSTSKVLALNYPYVGNDVTDEQLEAWYTLEGTQLAILNSPQEISCEVQDLSTPTALPHTGIIQFTPIFLNKQNYCCCLFIDSLYIKTNKGELPILKPALPAFVPNAGFNSGNSPQLFGGLPGGSQGNQGSQPSQGGSQGGQPSQGGSQGSQPSQAVDQQLRMLTSVVQRLAFQMQQIQQKQDNPSDDEKPSDDENSSAENEKKAAVVEDTYKS